MCELTDVDDLSGHHPIRDAVKQWLDGKIPGSVTKSEKALGRM